MLVGRRTHRVRFGRYLLLYGASGITTFRYRDEWEETVSDSLDLWLLMSLTKERHLLTPVELPGKRDSPKPFPSLYPDIISPKSAPS